jgi:hypothetical protein
LPWFEYYSDGKNLTSTDDTKKIKSAAEIDEETNGLKLLPDNSTIKVDAVKKIQAQPTQGVKDGNW